MRRWASAAAGALESRRLEIDRLNVFPVADADTGTNLSLTMRAAAEVLADADVGERGLRRLRVLASAAVGAALGNSGVIASQILVGLADGVSRSRRILRRGGAIRLRSRLGGQLRLRGRPASPGGHDPVGDHGGGGAGRGGRRRCIQTGRAGRDRDRRCGDAARVGVGTHDRSTRRSSPTPESSMPAARGSSSSSTPSWRWSPAAGPIDAGDRRKRGRRP